MGFFWKFTRSGRLSSSYVSLIIDVDPTCVSKVTRKWQTSFEELAMVMILLHDVEVLNQPSLGATKPAFKIVVQSLGYEPTLGYQQRRHQFGLVCGQSVMGRHGGAGLDWGRFALQHTPLTLDITDFQVACFINASDGRLFGNEDKLSCYRRHPDFIDDGEFYDLMPKHIVMNPIMTAMKKVDADCADRFARDCLGWTRL